MISEKAASTLKIAVLSIILLSAIVRLYSLTLSQPSTLSWNFWGYSDILINYSAGFVRRGLLGEILRHTFSHENFRNDLNALVFTWTLVTLALYAALIITNVKKIRLPEIIIATLAPGFFVYNILASDAFFRKEMAFAGASVLNILFVLAIQRARTPKARNYLSAVFVAQFAAQTLIFPFMHEGYIFTAFFLNLFIFWEFARECYPSKAKMLALLLIAEQIVLFVLFALVFNGNLDQALQIWAAVPTDLRPPNAGAIGALSYGALDLVALVKEIAFSLDPFYWLISFGLCLVTLYFLFLYQERHRTDFLRVCLFSFVGTLPLYVLGVDWGRWFSCFMVSAILAHFYFRVTPKPEGAPKSPSWLDAPGLSSAVRTKPVVQIVVMAAFLSIFFGINLPDCCIGSFDTRMTTLIPDMLTAR